MSYHLPAFHRNCRAAPQTIEQRRFFAFPLWEEANQPNPKPLTLETELPSLTLWPLTSEHLPHFIGTVEPPHKPSSSEDSLHSHYGR
ncbi:hypothetical protein AVEN_34837-1 [Araneus ventricosus]|uniref:Uncharacterized protein n=1 Tax=Araneus ventricosus TaxID=182803 RepID=A0A4Y2UBT8_ARAVE|nr:hypothetical protein AVEN_34837-1 [Araneus ventricosus]